MRLVRRVAVSLGVCLAATAVQWALWPMIRPSPYVCYFPALLLASIFGEIISATIIAILISQYLFIEPPFQWDLRFPADAIRSLLFALSATLGEILIRRLRREQRRSEALIQDLRRERDDRSRFVRFLGHDIVSPMTAAQLNVELLTRCRGDPSSFNPTLDRIKYSLRQATALIENLLEGAPPIRTSAGIKIPEF